ncbi:MAG: Immunoglobulin I-set domain protein [Pedosphaera sp.]|nr:Immunoglobulin I-set domain protein [Pedosphaera sp.]
MKLIMRKPQVLPLMATFFALLGIPSATAITYPELILGDHPVAYYRLEDLSGATVADSSGNGFTGNINPFTQNDGITTYPQLGLPGITTNSVFLKTADHPGGNGNIDIPVSLLMNPTIDGFHGAPFSAECWVQPTTEPAPGNYKVPVANFGVYSQTVGSPYANASGWNFYQQGGSPSTWVWNMKPGPFAGASVPITLLQWYHLVGTFDGTNSAFYINGVLQRTDNAVGYISNDGSADLVIGQGPATGQIPFDGGVDEVAIYTNALTAAQVLAHYQSGTNSFRAVPTPPSFLTPPADVTAYSGTPVTFSVVASGTTPLHYQWLRGNSPIAGATSSALSFTCHYPADDAATFKVVVTNVVGTATSSIATLTVQTNLNVVYNPFSITRKVGSFAAFRAVANGALPITYQWFKGAVPITGETNDTLWLAKVKLADDQSAYHAHITGPFGNSDTTDGILTVVARTVTVPITKYGQVVVADNPVAYLRLDESTGSTIATDAVGSFDGSYVQTFGPDSIFNFQVPTGIPHETNTAVHITNNALVTIPYALELNPVSGPWSVEVWLQPTSLNASDFHTPISSEYNDFAGHLTGWNVYQHVAGVWTLNMFSGGGGGSFTSEFTHNPLLPGTWYHMVITDDLIKQRWYVNNSLVLTQDRKGIGFVANGINGDPAVAGGPTVLGQRSDGIFGNFDGGLDELAFYNYALTPQQIQNHFLNTTKLTTVKSGSNVILTWGVGTLQSASIVTGPYANIVGATSPYTNAITGSQKYFRIQVQ